MSHWSTRLGMFSLPLLAITPHRAATRNHQPVIVLRSHHVPLPLVTRLLITVRGYLRLITSPHGVRRCISRANHKSPHGLRSQTMCPHKVISEYISGLSQKSSPDHIGVYLGQITNVLTRSRRDTGPGVLSSHLTKYFGLYHALTNLYPSRHALTITIHVSYNALSPVCCPQPATGYRPQVAAGLHAISNLP